MELMYPAAIIICLISFAIVIFLNLSYKRKYTSGKKIANTQFIKETEYYKKKIKKYKILSSVLKSLCAIVIILTGILIARPVTKQVKSDEKYNRDILIGLDISTSECEVNLELIKKFIDIMPSIEGDRIGIVIYNTAPIVYCPLTEDYDYVKECFETLIEQLEIAIDHGGYPPVTYEVDGEEVPMIWYSGVSLNSEERGSSLIGDGLVRNIIFFSRYKNKSR
jgi:hypothetical protein